LKYPEKCTACRDCIIVCRFNALELVNRKQPEQAADTSIKRAKINAFVWDSLYGLSSRR
jgi:Fe-S-cluster-containing hydrogenase component 2